MNYPPYGQKILCKMFPFGKKNTAIKLYASVN